MDSSIMPTKYPDLFLISTTDFFYPLVEDPYLQGKIAGANVLSDMYAMGVVDCDNLLMLLAASTDMTPKDRDIVTRKMIEGFSDLAKEAGTTVTGGQTVRNPWPIIGGVAMSTCKTQDFIMPVNAQPGDLIVLTKPLGTQVAVNVHQWIGLNSPNWEKVKDVITPEEGLRAFQIAETSMSRLNKTGAKLMHQFGAHAATDVTGFGLLGHARNLASNQKEDVYFELHTLPIIKKMKEVNDVVKFFRLSLGFSAETSGGLLVCLPADKAAAFCEEIEKIDKFPAWIVGSVKKAEEGKSRTAFIVDDPKVIEI
eukprot:TRINITY_DN1296_c0_g1_i1.p1 TRINITY_DN1296_c0_g1~~TRINITY_DN1296_c0_g1_i1.p1  ORF type:complete len:310 (-),score=94.92 TRINITY_DN1296_c0_g1_i1:210-1139(-)